MKPIKYELTIHAHLLSSALHESVERALHIKDIYLLEKSKEICVGDVYILTVKRLSIENEIYKQ